MGVDEQIDRLYELPLGEFTEARNALAKELGGEDGKRVKGLRKPTVAAWALNKAVRRSPDLLREFLEAGRQLRAAHEALLEGGEREAVDEAARRQRQAAAALADAAEEAADGGGTALRDRVTSTLRAALTDDEARAELESGRLIREREATGLGPLGAEGAADRPGVGRRSRERQRERAAREEVEEARERLRRAERRLRDAGQSVAAARERAEAAMEALERTQREEEQARTAVDEAAADVEARQRRLG